MTRLQRAGVVLSVVWFFAGGTWDWISESNAASDFAAIRPGICERARDQRQDWSTPDHCWDTFKHDFDAMDPHPVGNAILAGILPIPLAWLFVFVVIRVGRWILHGRWKPQENA